MRAQPLQGIPNVFWIVAALGPMEPGVQLKVLWLGLARWAALEAGERAALRDALERLLRSPVYFRTAAGIALQHGRGDLLRAASTAAWQPDGLLGAPLRQRQGARRAPLERAAAPCRGVRRGGRADRVGAGAARQQPRLVRGAARRGLPGPRVLAVPASAVAGKRRGAVAARCAALA